MSIKSINEAFERHANECQDQPLKEASSIKDQLASKLFNTVNNLLLSGADNIKTFEVALQDAIEEVFPENSWWEVVDLNIFSDLMETRDPQMTAINIIKNIHPEFLEEELTEAQISPEDERDNELLRSILAKRRIRSNAKLTPEEQEIFNKYLAQDDKRVTIRNTGPVDRSLVKGTENPNKINLVDRARKLPDRVKQGDFSARRNVRKGDDPNLHWGANSLDKERRNQALDMSLPVRTMKSALRDKNLSISRLADADDEYESAIKQAAADRDFKKAYYFNTKDRAQSTIDKLLKRESLKNKAKKHLKESWTDAYNEFIKISDRYLPDTDTIEVKVSELYDKHRGESDWDQAFSKWEEETYKYTSDEYYVGDNVSGRMYKGLNKALNAAAQFLQYSDDVIIQRATE